MAVRNSKVPAPTWKAGTVIPRTLKMTLPRKYTTKQMTRMARLVRRAQRRRVGPSISRDSSRNIDTEKNGDRMKNTFVKMSRNRSTGISFSLS